VCVLAHEVWTLPSTLLEGVTSRGIVCGGVTKVADGARGRLVEQLGDRSTTPLSPVRPQPGGPACRARQPSGRSIDGRGVDRGGGGGGEAAGAGSPEGYLLVVDYGDSRPRTMAAATPTAIVTYGAGRLRGGIPLADPASAT